MPELKELKMTDLNPHSIKRNFEPREWSFKDYPGMAIKRVGRTEYWVYDIAANKGVLVSEYNQALDLLKALASLEF